MTVRRAPLLRGPADPDLARPVRSAVMWSRLAVALAVLIAVGVGARLFSPSAQMLLVVAGLGLLAGIPHGGADHLMVMRLAGRSEIPVVLGYAALAAAAWAALRWGGPLALLGVIVLSVVHFGLGELEVSAELTGWRPSWVVAGAIVVAGSGALLLPLARSGEQFQRVAVAVSPGLARLIGEAPVRTGVLLLWAVAAVVAVTAALIAGHGSVALDIVLIGALGLLAPPLVAFAVWFGGWHAIRHSARMLAQEPGCAELLAAHRDRAAWARLALLAAPMSVAVLAVVVALGWFTATAPDPIAVLAGVLRILLALTVPHMVVVWWLDRIRGADQAAQRG